MPAKVSLTAQVTLLDLSSRANDSSPWVADKDRQELLTLARAFGRHTIQVTARDFSDISPLSSQQQTALEIDDNFHLRRLTLGGGVRAQRLVADGPRTTMFYRGSAQFSAHRISVYGNFETGKDLENKTLFATNTVSTTLLGASMTMGKNWQIQFEAYRNSLVTELNPQSIFVLQGQGVFIPGTLAALNQWSIYFRVVRKLKWGAPGAAGDINAYALRQAPLKGSVEGFVMEGDQPAEGVSVISMAASPLPMRQDASISRRCPKATAMCRWRCMSCRLNSIRETSPRPRSGSAGQALACRAERHSAGLH